MCGGLKSAGRGGAGTDVFAPVGGVGGASRGAGGDAAAGNKPEPLLPPPSANGRNAAGAELSVAAAAFPARASSTCSAASSAGLRGLLTGAVAVVQVTAVGGERAPSRTVIAKELLVRGGGSG
jgi:hypothetical protein